MSFVVCGLLTATGVAQKVESFGVFGGFNFPFTIDQGLQKDPRFYGRFTIRESPFGINYGYDNVGFGFVLTPSMIKVGQQFTIRNTVGGEIGKRDVQMSYVSLPVALKIHLNDLAFFRLSLVAAVNFDYLLKGQEVFTHFAGKVKYPASVRVPAEPGYEQVYDGVFIPEVSNLVYVSKENFRPFQLSAGLGLRSDFDLNDHWSINFDGRANFGVFDPRKPSYTDQLRNGVDVPDLPGQRREVYLSVAIGFAHIIIIKEKFKSRSSSLPRGVIAPQRLNKKPKG
jgi:hypothetical protein